MSEDLRSRLRIAMELDRLSLRQLDELTGVSFSTLSRFLRGSEITHQNARRLEAWLSGEQIKESTPISKRVHRVGGLKFLITVELIGDE